MTKNGKCLRVSWFIDFAYSTRNHHGGILRFLNYSRELIARGHEVNIIYSVESANASASEKWFQDWQDRGVISSFACLEMPMPAQWRIRAGSLLFHPACTDYLLKSARAELVATARQMMQRQQSDLFVISNRKLHFLAAALGAEVPCVIDFCDSESLYFFRQAKHLLTKREVRNALYSAKRMIGEILIERYYSKRAARNVVVSAVDQKVLTRLNGFPHKNVVVMNGVAESQPRPFIQKTPNQIIFSGNMSFAPNYESALWLIDRVFPLVLAQIPDAKLVIAGANPVAELKNRQRENIQITGFVEDLPGMVAASALYVAPMVSGGGFKNKVVEAITHGTYVVSTPIGVEFLNAELRALFTVASTPETLAARIVAFLQDPASLQTRLKELQSAVQQEFSWSGSTDRLLGVLQSAIAAGQPRPLSNPAIQQNTVSTPSQVS